MFIALSLTSFAQVGIGTTTPHASAALDVSSTTKGLLPPRMTKAQMYTIVSPAQGLMVYCTDCTPKGLYLYSGDGFYSIPLGNIIMLGIDTGTTVVDVTGTDGRVWMDRNLGATQVATSSTDAASYGDLYQWGRAKDGHESRTSTTTATTVTSGNPGHGNFITVESSGTDYNWTDFAGEDGLWQSGLNDPCPSGYRIPTETELNGELLNFPSDNPNGAFTSLLKLPVPGYRKINNTVASVGILGRYSSSTVNGTKSRNLLLDGDTGFASMSSSHRAEGHSVRCIKD